MESNIQKNNLEEKKNLKAVVDPDNYRNFTANSNNPKHYNEIPSVSLRITKHVHGVGVMNEIEIQGKSFTDKEACVNFNHALAHYIDRLEPILKKENKGDNK